MERYVGELQDPYFSSFGATEVPLLLFLFSLLLFSKFPHPSLFFNFSASSSPLPSLSFLLSFQVKQHVYRVRFDSNDIWTPVGGDGGDAGFSVDVEILETWLEEVGEGEVEKGPGGIESLLGFFFLFFFFFLK